MDKLTGLRLDPGWRRRRSRHADLSRTARDLAAGLRVLLQCGVRRRRDRAAFSAPGRDRLVVLRDDRLDTLDYRAVTVRERVATWIRIDVFPDYLRHD